MMKEEYERLNKALEFLKNEKFLFDEIEKIKGGINSNCWKIQKKNKSYFLKFYKSTSNDNRNRFSTELSFLNVLKKENFDRVPIVLFSDQTLNCALLSWLEGEKIKKVSSSQWQEYLEFIIKLQNLKCSKYAYQIKNASEACFSIESHYLLIENRLRILFSKISEDSLYHLLDDWLKEKIPNILKYLKVEIDKNKNFNKIPKNQKIISPSDVGFHNVLYKSDKLNFFDFEYAGWDDAYKLFVDLIIRPENLVKQEKALEIVYYLAKRMDIYFEKRKFKIYLELYRIKWILIILNKVNKNEINSENQVSELFIKISNYYKDVGSIWGLKN